MGKGEGKKIKTRKTEIGGMLGTSRAGTDSDS